MYPIEERLLPLGGRTNRPGTPLTPTEVVCHRTGNQNPQADALAHHRYFSSGYRAASAHYFVDSERILRVIPEGEIAWHAGPVANKKALSIELCENHRPGTQEFERAYRQYVWLVADICRRYNLDPVRDVKGHFEYDPVNRPNDPNGLLAEYYKAEKGAAWIKFKAEVLKVYSDSAIREVTSTTQEVVGTPILGKPQATIDQARAFLRKRAPGWEMMAELYWGLAPVYGVRPEVALAQACKETGYFRYGGAVTPDMNNFCGLKVRQAAGDRKIDHASFPDRATGVEAHCQHLARYAGGTVPSGRPIVDPRFDLVRPGAARTVEELGGKWAPNPDYGRSIVRDYLRPLMETVPEQEVPMTPVLKPAWDPQVEIERLLRDGLINSPHDPEQAVTWGELATVLNRMRRGADA